MNCSVCKKQITDADRYPAHIKRGAKLCKSCSNARGTTFRRLHPEKSREYSQGYYKTHPKYNVAWGRQNRIDIRKEMIAAYGGKCVRCGIENPIVLDIDHLDNNGCADRKRGMWGWRLYRLLRKNKYPKDNFQLLCRNCNWIKHMESPTKSLRESQG
jgi:hypothetical protein